MVLPTVPDTHLVDLIPSSSASAPGDTAVDAGPN